MTTLSTLTMTSSTSGPTTRAFWERLWRMSGINFVIFSIIAYVIYGHQPQAGASADALAGFYDGERTRILLASIFSGISQDGFGTVESQPAIFENVVITDIPFRERLSAVFTALIRRRSCWTRMPNACSFPLASIANSQ